MTPSDICVLTGDIVASSKLSADGLDAALDVLRGGAAVAAGWSGLESSFTRFRGDGWQSLGPAPRLALRAVLFMQARLRAADLGCDTRISAAIGPGVVPDSADLASASGPVFEMSGRNLDAMARGRRLALGRVGAANGGTAEQAVVALCDEISGRWTARQAAVFVLALQPGAGPQAEHAARLGVSQQMIAKHLKAGGDRALRVALAAVEGPESS